MDEQKIGELALTSEPSPSDLLRIAVESKLPLAELKELMAMKKEWDAEQSRKQFFKALAKFQSVCPVITRDRAVNYLPKNGGPAVNYKFADLGSIIEQIREPLKESGLSYRWEISQTETSINVKTIITHESGHSESTTLSALADDSGGKNRIQQYGSTISYLRRYGLTGQLGIGTAEDDIDAGDVKDKKKPVAEEKDRDRTQRTLGEDRFEDE